MSASAFSALAPLRQKLAAEQEALADELMDRIDDFLVDLVTTVDIAHAAEAWFTARLLALQAVYDDEMDRPKGARDVEWLSASLDVWARALRYLGAVRLKRAKLERLA